MLSRARIKIKSSKILLHDYLVALVNKMVIMMAVVQVQVTLTSPMQLTSEGRRYQSFILTLRSLKRLKIIKKALQKIYVSG